MRITVKLIGAAFFIISILNAALAEEKIGVRSLGEDENSPSAKVEQLAWLVGYWEGEGLGGKVAEVVAPPAGGQMMGAFYSLKSEGDLSFYEFYVFAEVEDTLILRIKHFTSDFVGWEEKDKFVEFPLVAVEDNAVYFDGLTFAKTGPGEMRSAVNIGGQGTAYFTYERKELE
ncbi:MAG: hypothetical protein DHS20C05_10610 [Hyphococcus sp.]|nr:MAG: hypothetical protein DHS20C05_10610 [Marinicaulis sp.]